MENNAVLQMRNIHKSFPGVKALSGVDFTLRKGEIHALMGENGAGKSTLIKVLTGVYTKDEGHIYLDGHEKEVQIRSPQEAQKLGISPVYQEITLCPNLSVAENMYIGRTPGAVQNWRKMNKAADKLLKSLDIPAKAAQQLSTCSLAVQQMIAIARAVDTDCKVLFLLYEDIIKRCEKACHHHSQLSDNLFQIITKKSQALSLRINLLTAKTVRQRLLHYLTYQQGQKGQPSFSIDMSLTELAEYLGVDRSSLMREIRGLKAQGILSSKGRVFSFSPPLPDEKGGVRKPDA